MWRIGLFVALWVLSTFPAVAVAGAWLRDEGKAFFSFGATVFELDEDGRQYQENSFYLEYGLRPNLTIGASGSVVDGMGGEGQVFFRMPLPRENATSQLALEFGLGANSQGIDYEPFAKAGVSWGKGITLNERNGWINVDGAAFLGDDTRVKLDTTFGLTLSDRVQVMAQSFIELADGQDSHTLIPSLILSSKAGKTRYLLGYEHRSGTRASKGMKFGLWRDF